MTGKITTIGCFVLFVFALDCSAQTLADAARRERERQKQLHSVVVVVNGATTTTAASTSSTTGATTTTAASTSSTASTSAVQPAKPTGPLDLNGHDEKYWRTRFDKARADLKKAQDNVQVLDLKIKDLNTQLLRQSDIYNREYRLGPQIAETQKQLDDANRQVDDAKKKIADLDDELRRAGGLAGWAR